jgi:hypothetical protein
MCRIDQEEGLILLQALSDWPGRRHSCGTAAPGTRILSEGRRAPDHMLNGSYDWSRVTLLRCDEV